jgi:hypothetical protein
VPALGDGGEEAVGVVEAPALDVAVQAEFESKVLTAVHHIVGSSAYFQALSMWV